MKNLDTDERAINISGNLPEVAELIIAAETEARHRWLPQLLKSAEMPRAVRETGVLTGDSLSELLSQEKTPEAAG